MKDFLSLHIFCSRFSNLFIDVLTLNLKYNVEDTRRRMAKSMLLLPLPLPLLLPLLLVALAAALSLEPLVLGEKSSFEFFDFTGFSG